MSSYDGDFSYNFVEGRLGRNGARDEGGKSMVHALLRGGNGNEIVEIAVEVPQDPRPSDKRRCALLNVPRELFNKALGEAARRPETERPAVLVERR